MIYLVGVGFARETEVERIGKLPDFRRATRNMVMAYASLEPLVSTRPAGVGEATGLIFGSSHGELETTKEFLKTLAERKLARPILFQNSLHHSTAGFLAVKIGMTAPTLTFSNGEDTAEDAFEAARMLLTEGMFDSVFVTVADGCVPDLREVMELNHFPRGARLGEGAATLLLTTKPEDFGGRWIARFREGFRTVDTPSEATAPSFLADGTPDYATGLLERLALAASGTMSECGATYFSERRRDGRFREIAWERPA
jgi:hypothetical protein